ncbi:hypothetical protein MHB77_23190 [Paenibacillus sp. FSL K6-3166]|uniref:hypothetical protein n=1 Tax=Paenibacillus sp. FSL K6-3166 TaxID=2921492 RepID=UPI00117C7635
MRQTVKKQNSDLSVIGGSLFVFLSKGGLILSNNGYLTTNRAQCCLWQSTAYYAEMLGSA